MIKIEHWTTAPLSGIDLKVFREFDQAIMGCPVGSKRLLWDKDALKRQDDIIDNVIARFRSDIIDKCFEIIKVLGA